MSIISPAYISIKIFLLISATFYVGYMYGIASKQMEKETKLKCVKNGRFKK